MSHKAVSFESPEYVADVVANLKQPNDAVLTGADSAGRNHGVEMLRRFRTLLVGFASAKQYLKITPFETETAAGRTKERYRRATLTLFANILSRGIALIAMFISLRIALPYLGQERFGVMSTITSFAALLTFLDLGIGNGLVSQVARLRAAGHKDVLALQVGSAIFILSIVGLIVSVVLTGLSLTMPLEWVFRSAAPDTISEARSTLAVFAILFGFSIPLGAVQRVFAGLQEGYTATLISSALSLSGLLILHLLPFVGAGMPSFLVATYGIQVLAGAVMLCILFKRKLVRRPGRADLSRRHTKSLLATGGLFFVLQIGAIVTTGIDNVLISSMLGPASVAAYVVVQRMFMLVTAPIAMFNSPLWAAYADAAQSGDTDYIRTTFTRSFSYTPIAGIALASIICVSHAQFAEVLTKGQIVLIPAFVYIFALWSIMESTGSAFAMYLNGMGIVAQQVLVVISFVVISIPLKLYLLHQFGLVGLVSATIAAYLVSTVLPYSTIFRRTVMRPISKL
jgi:O-antigen/teichoic acid export membrane protein